MKAARNAAKIKKMDRLTANGGVAEDDDDSWDPLVDEDSFNILWDEADTNDDSEAPTELHSSAAEVDENPTSIKNATPGSKVGDAEIQDTQEEKGTPSHATENFVWSSRLDAVARSIGRELNAVKQTVEGMVSWREGVDVHMESISKKLDLLLNVMLPTRRSAPSTLTELHQENNTNTNPITQGGYPSILSDPAECPTGIISRTQLTGY
ncbi:hypothetical protein KC19_VG157500 [Ceratodon purpureus]|uniref:Uncharacterized protein n=1 Tax=Ceratodon purpureus TaxID=3225 RepID=A0A8T0HQI9_CERPU|nr:hypothetical protein KC19_VG157500 [Ceratodon purpureus]